MIRVRLTQLQLKLLRELSPKVFRVPSPRTNSSTVLSLVDRGYIVIRSPDTYCCVQYGRYPMCLQPAGVEVLKCVAQSEE
jgi:hypothetical protein